MLKNRRPVDKWKHAITMDRSSWDYSYKLASKLEPGSNFFSSSYSHDVPFQHNAYFVFILKILGKND